MCTAITFNNNDFYFGRNLDLDYHFGEKVVITPRNYPLSFKQSPTLPQHFAMIGMATVINNYPLYAEAVNEKGLAMAGLNFPDNAYFPKEVTKGKSNITPYEIIGWTLAQYSTVQEVRKAYQNLVLVDIDFMPGVPVAPLHWIVADKDESIVLESTHKGIKIYDNPVGVLTNNPEFDFHLLNLNQYLGLSAKQPKNTFSDKVTLNAFGLGAGGFGLPGDFSPPSRFVKAVFVKENSVCDSGETASVVQFFHFLDSVKMVKGVTETPANKDEITIYSCCVNTRTLDYYYKTYENPNICKINFANQPTDSADLICFELNRTLEFGG